MTPTLNLTALKKLLPDLGLEAGCLIPAGAHHRAAAVQVLDQLCSSTAPGWLWTAESREIISNHTKPFPAGHEQRGDKPLAEHYPLAGEQGPADEGGSSCRLGQTGTTWILWEQAKVEDRSGVIVTWRMRGTGSLILVYEVGFELQPAGDLRELRATEFRFIGFSHAQPTS